MVNYEMHQNLLTSFTGKDLLYTRLNSGNAKSSSLGGNPFNLLILDKITTPRASPNILEITRPYYRFPMGGDLSVLLGPRARASQELSAIRPWFYSAETGPPILDFFSLHGAPATYNKATGGRQQLAMAVSYAAPNADNAEGGDALNAGGVMGEYTSPAWLRRSA